MDTALEDYKVLTFDCFGTLIDWESGILDALKPFRRDNNITATSGEILEQYAWLESTMQRGAYRPYRDILGDVMRALALCHGVDGDAIDAGAIVCSLPRWKPFADTVASLHALQKRFKLAIVSNIDDDLFAHTERVLQTDFDWVVTAQQARAYKPSHQVFARAFATIGCPREQILHVAQSRFHDIKPAAELGLQSVWINRRGHRPGSGATAVSDVVPEVSFTDLASFVAWCGLG